MELHSTRATRAKPGSCENFLYVFKPPREAGRSARASSARPDPWQACPGPAARNGCGHARLHVAGRRNTVVHTWPIRPGALGRSPSPRVGAWSKPGTSGSTPPSAHRSRGWSPSRRRLRLSSGAGGGIGGSGLTPITPAMRRQGRGDGGAWAWRRVGERGRVALATDVATQIDSSGRDRTRS